MSNYLTKELSRKVITIHSLSKIVLIAAALFSTMVITGCQTSQTANFPDSTFARSQPVTLREGDVLKITFPGAPNLNTTQQVRRDGKVTLPLLGEQNAAGKVPSEFQ